VCVLVIVILGVVEILSRIRALAAGATTLFSSDGLAGDASSV